MNRSLVGMAVAIIISCVMSASHAQTFVTPSGGVIPDNNTEVCFAIPVTGLPTVIDTTFGLVQLCIDITHTYVGDLKITLKSPDNTTVLIANHVGGSGDNFTSTCLAMNGTNGWLLSGSAPFTGTYIPEQSLNLFNTGMNPNGTWNICVKDEVPADIGNLNFAAITFGSNPPPDPGLPPGICSTTNASGCVCPDTTMTDCDLLPDMTASALIIQNQHTEYPGYLTLSNATPNIGYGPLEIRGTNTCYCDTVIVGCATPICPDGSYPKNLITQRIYHKNGQTMTSWDRPAGTMTYHPTHGHMHVDDWATYTLRAATSDPNPLNWPIIGDGAKVSFCLINLGSCSGNPGYCVDSLGNTITGANIPNNGLGSVTGCGNQQGIYAGSLDIYGQGLAGQQIDFPGICNGDYYIISHTDPNDNMLEMNENNNHCVVPITLTMQGTGPANPTFNFVTNGLSVDFNSAIPGAISYLWIFGDGDSANVATVNHIYSTPGTYNVMLQVSNGVCTSYVAQAVTVNSTVGLQQLLNKVSDVSIIPNPFTNVTDLSFSLNSSDQVRIELINTLGEKVELISNEYLAKGKHQIRIDPEATGVYFVKIYSQNTSSVHRIVRLK
jgi:subtilisin-like proprotein convertase family protein